MVLFETFPVCKVCIDNYLKYFRQLGPPTLFLTLSSSEYAWDDLLISILKTKNKPEIKELLSQMKTDSIAGIPKSEFLNNDVDFIKSKSNHIVEEMSSPERNRFVNDNIVLTTIEFQNRVQHISKLLKTRGFMDSSNKYKVEDSFLRIEHQMRGAPHAHCLLWLVEEGQYQKKKVSFNGEIKEISVPKPAPTFKNSVFGKVGQEREEGKKNLIDFIDSLITIDQGDLATRNIHGHTFTCQKGKKKIIRIQPNEGHGKFKIPKDSELLVVPSCRFGFPRFPMERAMILEPLNPADVSEEQIKIATKNYKKIQKFMTRQCFGEERKRFFSLTFQDFLWHLDLSEAQYYEALQSQIKGRAKLFLKRTTSQSFINNYNQKIMEKHNSNMDISVVFDEYQVAQGRLPNVTML